MKVMYAVVNYPPLFSGRAKQASYLKSKLESIYKEINIDVFSLDQSKLASRVAATDNDVLRCSYRNRLSAIIIFITRVLIGKCDVIHFHGLSYLILSAPLFKFLGKKIVFHMSSDLYDDPKTLNSRLITKILVKYVDNIIVQKKSLAINSKCVFVPNILSLNPKLSNRVHDGVIKILVSGVICPRKRQLDIIRSVISSGISGIELHFAGSYVDDFNEFDEQYIKDVINISDKNKIVHLHGHLKKNELILLMSRCQYFIAASSQEGLSNAYVECMATNLIPIIQENHGKVDELFEYLDVEKHSIILKDMSDINYKVLNEHLTDCKFNFSKNVLSKFSEDTVTKQVLDIYK
ncbi:glycosyltransferase family 4 protein [Vibrio chagasii]|uniref:glycosyltransferase family 4 protein n=1 Tax=Vibrio chagasii TaxID=170679 RepID=UPI003DA8F668